MFIFNIIQMSSIKSHKANFMWCILGIFIIWCVARPTCDELQWPAAIKLFYSFLSDRNLTPFYLITLLSNIAQSYKQLNGSKFAYLKVLSLSEQALPRAKINAACNVQSFGFVWLSISKADNGSSLTLDLLSVMTWFQRLHCIVDTVEF